jgi:TIR domain
MPKKVPFLFISHVREDEAAAMEIVTALERGGMPCWVAPRDVRPGKPFDDEIVEAIENCRAMLLIFSDHCNKNDYIRREVTVAGEVGKDIVPFRIEDVEPRGALRMRLSDLHWIDAFVSREHAIDEVTKIFAPPPPPPPNLVEPITVPPIIAPPPKPPPKPHGWSRRTIVICVAVGIVGLVMLIVLIPSKPPATVEQPAPVEQGAEPKRDLDWWNQPIPPLNNK